MKFDPKQPARSFVVGTSAKLNMHDCGTLHLEPDEQITFLTPAGGQYDVARKDWGFYATPSLNGRLTEFRLRAVLVKNRGTGRFFVLLVEGGHEPGFDAYCTQENLVVVTWLDDTQALQQLERALSRD